MDTSSGFGLAFQMGLIKLALKRDHFCSQVVKFLGNDPDLKKNIVFENAPLHHIFLLVTQGYNEYGTRPTEGQLEQMINAYPDKGTKTHPSKSMLNEALAKVYEADIHNEDFIQDHAEAYIRRVKFIKAINSGVTEFKKDKMNSHAAHMAIQEHLDEITKVSFGKDDTLVLSDIDGLLASNTGPSSTIPTGVHGLDAVLNGGLPRDSLVVALGGTNVGKTMFVISIAANCLRACHPSTKENLGNKVLHVALEGTREEALYRYMSNLADVSLGDISNNTLSKKDREKVNGVTKQLDKQLLILNELEFNMSIESFIVKVREIYKEFEFDMLVIDYGQLLSSENKNLEHRHVMANAFRGLAAIARETNSVVISPAQATRGAQTSQEMVFKGRDGNDKLPILKVADISEAFEIARVAAVILTLNMTEEEKEESKLRVFLEKQRAGETKKTFTLLTDYPKCNLIGDGHAISPGGTVIGKAMGNIKEDEEDIPQASIQSILGGSRGKTIEKLKALLLEKEEVQKSLNEKREDANNEGEENPFEKDDPKGVYAKLKNEEQELADELKEMGTNYKNLFISVYPNPTNSQLESLQEQYDKIKDNPDNEKHIKDLEELIQIYEEGLK
jgi:replicative DNA helicase